MLTDTFNLHTERNGFPRDWIPNNSERAERQQKTPIQVIVGNPPWSTGQRSSADDNPNVEYPEIEGRIAETYAAKSSATLKNSLYDMYKMAIRWASDRIGEQGVIAFVTNGSWIDGNVDSGVRACLAEEFTSVHVLNLRGNQRTQGERSRREGGKIFGQCSRAPVAITILARSPNGADGPCRIRYRDIGDYLTREEKLSILRDAGSIVGVSDWQDITPDEHHDWIDQRDESFQRLFPVGTKAAKAGRAGDAVFKLYSRGFATSRDAYLYNFSRDACEANARAAVNDYRAAMQTLRDVPGCSVEEAAAQHSSNVRWDRELKNNLRRRKAVGFSADRVWRTQYRPFAKQHCYVEYVLVNNKYQMDSIFPAADSENRAICVPGVGSTKPFSTLITDAMPDLHFVAFGQCIPRYRYEIQTNPQAGLAGFDAEPENPQAALPGFEGQRERVDNISDAALRAFHAHYGDQSITKDQIFDYVYGVLHAPDYRERFANDLAKQLPRVPFASDFHTFADAGHELADLHLGYEHCTEYPLEVEFTQEGKPEPRHFQIGRRAMRFKDEERSILEVNEHVRITRIPGDAHEYQVNGRTPLEWCIDRYRIVQDRESGIVNDPNGWFEQPEDLIIAMRRMVHVSVETNRIVRSLPTALEQDSGSANGGQGGRG